MVAVPKLRLRATCNNHTCWKKGEVFEAKFYEDGTISILCHANKAGHVLLTEDGHDVTVKTLHLCPDMERI